jgi:two-component system cell cycle response regulator DivK
VEAVASRPPDAAPDRPVVLIVDDTPDGRDIYSLYLQHQGFTVVTARDGNEGVEVAREHQPDVIIMDIAMARLDGIAATKRLKRDARTRRTPVIILTAFPEKPVQQRAMEAGASLFLTKPCLPDQLEGHIRRLLAAKPAA